MKALLFWAAVVSGAVALHYRSWVRHRRHYAVFAGGMPVCRGSCAPLTQAQANLLGWVLPPADLAPTSFFKVPPAKRPGTTRIGVFGCSFVAGDEVAAGQDFPTLLQERFRRAGRRDVEVVNFGVSAYGMHQAYLLWQFLGQRYGLDETVFMPFEFHESRDTTFLMDTQAYGPIHSRFILDGGRLRLIAAAGASNKERSAGYYRMLPLWRYLRYDSKPPALLRSLLPASLSWKANPFYYWRGRDDEAFETYALIFRALADSAKSLYVVSDGDGALASRLAAAVGEGRAHFLQSRLFDFTAKNRTLYYAPHGHMSALGNRARADELYAWLSGRSTAVLDLPELRPAVWPAGPRAPGLPLDRAASVSVRAAGKIAGAFQYYDEDCLGCVTGRSPDFKKDGLAALLIEDRPEARLIGLHRPLRDGERVFLRLPDGRPSAVGAVRSPDGVLGRLVFSRGLPAAVSGAALTRPEGDILVARPGGSRGWRWKPADAPYYIYVRAPEGGGPSPADLPGVRSLDLVELAAGGRRWSRPLFGLARRRVSLPLDPETRLTGR